MSQFKEKSNQNLQAAKILINERQLYASGVNRSYYACVQLVFHYLFTKFGVDQEQFEKDRRTNKAGSHQYAINLIGPHIAKIDLVDYKWFQKHFPELKELREKSDYTTSTISQEEAFKSIATSDSMLNTLKKVFK